MKLLIFLLCLWAFSATAQDSTATYHRIPYTVTSISVNISPVTINGTKLQRKATLFTMNYNLKAQFLALSWTVSFYADSANTYGASLAGIIPSYSIENVADNNTFVNPANGQILTPDSLQHYPMAYMGQYDFFNYIAEKQAVVVHDVLRQYAARALNWEKR